MKGVAIVILFLAVLALTYVTDMENRSQQAQISSQHRQIIELEKRIHNLEKQ